MEVDEALQTVGGYKRWHLTIFCMLSVSSLLPLCVQDLGIIFIGWMPPHHCCVPEGGLLNETIPRNPNGEYEKCLVYVNGSDFNKTESCESWHYYSGGHETIVTEWNLVCSSDFLSSLSQVFYRVGSSTADIIGSFLSDKFGRKRMHIGANVLISVTGTTVAFAPNYITFVSFRIICGMLAQVIVNSGVTLLMETFDSSNRAFAGIGLEFLWIPTYMLPALMGYFIMDWRIQQLVSSLITLCWISYIWLAVESVPWLVAKNKYNEAEKVLQKMARYNGVHNTPKFFLKKQSGFLDKGEDREENLTSDTLLATQSKQETEIPKRSSSVPLQEMFCDPKLRKHFLIVNFIWFSNTTIYYGLTLITPSLGPNRFLSYVVMGLVELPSYAVCLCTVNRFGRKIPQAGFFLIAGVSLITAAFIPKTTESGVDLMPLMVTMVMIGKFGITGSFAVMVLFARELFPTTLRSSSSAWGAIAGGIGTMIAPLQSYVAKHVFWLPNVFFGVVALTAALATLPLPETMNKPLPQTTEEMYVVYYGETKRDPPSKSTEFSLN